MREHNVAVECQFMVIFSDIQPVLPPSSRALFSSRASFLHPSVDACSDHFSWPHFSILPHSIFCRVQLSHYLPYFLLSHPNHHHSVTFHPLSQKLPVVPNIKELIDCIIIYYHIYDSSRVFTSFGTS